MISIEAYRASVGRFYDRAKVFHKIGNMCHCKQYEDYFFTHSDHNTVLYEMGFYRTDNDEYKEFNVVEWDTIEDAQKSYGFGCIEVSDLGLYNVSFLKLSQLLDDGDVESNPGPATNNVAKTPAKGRPKKTGFKGTPKKLKLDLSTVQPVSLDNIKPWSVTCPSTMDILSNKTFKVNPDINAKVSLYQGDITELKVDAIVNAANEKLLGGGNIDGAIHKAAGTKLRDECSRFTEKNPGIRCEIGECKVTSGYKLPANYVFHTVGPRDKKNENKLKDCYESCLQNVLTYDIKSIAFCCIATGIFGFDQRKAAKIALNSVRLWLESNYLSVDHIIFCTYKNDDFGIYKDLMSTVYFPLLNNHLTDNIDETPCKKYLSATNAEISPELVDLTDNIDETPCKKYLSATNVEIIPELVDLSKSPMMNSPNSCKKTPMKGRLNKSESFTGTASKKKLATNTTSDIDFSITAPLLLTNVRGPNIPLGLKNEGVNVCFFNSVVQVLYSLPLFRNHIKFHQISPSNSIAKGITKGIKNLFGEIENSNEPVKTSKHVRNLGLRNYNYTTQHDAHECLIHILESCYPNNTDDSMFKVAMHESTVCQIINGTDDTGCGNRCAEKDVFNIDLQLDVDDNTNQLQTIQGLLNMLIDPHGKGLPDYRCERCRKRGFCTTASSVTHIADVLIIQLNIFRFDELHGIRKVIPTLNIDHEIRLFDTLTLQGIIYHDGDNANCGHYTSAVKVNDRWFSINDTNVSNKQRFSCTASDRIVPYILVYKKRNDLIVLSAPVLNPPTDVVNVTLPIVDESLNEKCNTVVTPDSVVDLVSDPERMNRQSLMKELNTQKERIINVEKSRMKDANCDDKSKKTKSTPVKRKRKYTKDRKDDANRTSDKKRKAEMLKNCDDDAKNKLNEKKKKGMAEMRKILDDDEKDTHRTAAKKGMAEMLKNLDDDAKNKLNEKKKKGMAEMRGTFSDVEKVRDRTAAKKRMDNLRQNNKTERLEAFNDVHGMSMVDPAILDTPAYKIIQEEFQAAIEEGPTYICDICYKLEYRTNVMKLDPSKYETEIFDKCHTGKSEWICKSCHKSMLKKKMPAQAQANNLKLCPKFDELECLCPIELMLISQIIPFMFIVAKHKGAQHGLKGQCVLVPADLKKIQTVLPRSCNEEYLISLALKRRLSDTSVVNKQNIRPALVNKALQKLKEINPFYKDVIIDTTWENVSEQSDPELWKLLTDENAKPQNDETDSDDEIEGNDHAHEKEKRMSSVPYPTALHNIDGPNISPDEIVNIAPGEGQIPVSVTSEPDWEALAFPKDYSTGKNHFNEPREVRITPSKYVHARLKCCDDRFASNPQYIFHALDWIEKTAVFSSINFQLKKQFQSDINAGQLLNSDNISRMISDDEIFAAFKNIRGTPQYFHNMMLDVLAKIRQYGVSTFFLTFSAAEFRWPEIIKIVAYQYGETLTTEQVNEMDWNTKVKYLKRNPITVARQIDYIFGRVFGKILYSGMHPIGEILNHDDRREFQGRGAEHIHASIHILNAPKIDENEDSEVEEFIDKYITCSLPDEDEYPELNDLVKSVQTHHHTTTCRKKKGVTCRFNAPWPPSNKTRIVRGGDIDEVKLKESKKILDKVLNEITSRLDLSDVTLEDILESCNVSETEYSDALECGRKKVSIIYKRRPCEKDISPYNTVILSLLKSNMNIQFVTGIYGLLTYLTSYLCKPEHTMSELMKKAGKEASGKDIKGKLRAIGDVFLTKREVSTHEAGKRVNSLPMRTSNIDTIFLATGIKKDRTRMLKSPYALQTMHPEDTNVYATNMIERYANRPDELEEMCYADFGTNYKPKAEEVESDDIKNYTTPVSAIDEVEPSSNVIVLKNELGKMRKRSRPCVMRYHKVSKMKDSEQYYLTLLQLYMPWRNEDKIKGEYHSYEDKYLQVESSIMPNIKTHDPYFGKYDIDTDDLDNYAASESDEDEDDNDFGMINPDLIDLDFDEDSGGNSVPVASTRVEIQSIPRELYYEMCSQLNERQQHLFNYIMKYATKYRLYKKNDEPMPPLPFHIFLSGGAGVGKSFLVNLITEYLKRILKYPEQMPDEQPSVVVAASTGKAATNINGTTLHSAFDLPVRKEGLPNKTTLSNEKLHKLRIKYKYLKVLLTDEISMTGKLTFDDLNRFLRLIKNNEKDDFGGVCILLIGDFNQLNPVMQSSIYNNIRLNDAWNLFSLHELHEIVRQSSDPEFAQLLNRLREGNHTRADIEEIKSLANTDTSTWPNDYIKLYVTNALVNKENNECIKKLVEDGATIFTSRAYDSKSDKHTGSYKLSIGEDVPISKTGSLPKTLKTCVDARVMLTVNEDTWDRLINGSTGTVKHLDRVKNNCDGTPPSGTIYVKFDDPKAGNKQKDRRLRGELKECVPIKPVPKEFSYTRGKSNITVERKQFPLVLAHAMTIHKAQGSTLEYMRGDLDQTTSSKRPAPVGPGMLYTLLSRAKSRDKIQLLNFQEKHIKINQSAVQEMERMRKECILPWDHPLADLNGTTICLFNIRSWNLHIEHFLSDKVYSTQSSIFCFTETHMNNNESDKDIKDYQEGWANIHKATEHGLAICYDTTKVEVVEEFQTGDVLQLLPVRIKIQDEHVLLILLYRPPGPIGNFIQELIHELDSLPTDEYRTLIVGDFNLDQMLDENVEMLQPLITRFNFHQRSQYSTHILGGILDLVLDNDKPESVEWMPSPYSDHFVIFIEI